MMSQETIDFNEDIVKIILSRWIPFVHYNFLKYE